MRDAELAILGFPTMMARDSKPAARSHETTGEEATLAAQALAGDAEAFGSLVERYAATARRVARAVLDEPEDADDAAQEAFLTAWRKLKQYDPKRPFGPWILRIVANAARDIRRARRVRETEPLAPGLASTEASPADQTDRSLLRARLDTALASLPERQRLAVVMFDVEGYPHADIAEILDVPDGTVRSLVFHGRRALRKALSPIMGELK
jgi:RNA polymerase sigma-70 factor (ECF subfamily)